MDGSQGPVNERLPATPIQGCACNKVGQLLQLSQSSRLKSPTVWNAIACAISPIAFCHISTHRTATLGSTDRVEIDSRPRGCAARAADEATAAAARPELSLSMRHRTAVIAHPRGITAQPSNVSIPANSIISNKEQP
jgi:hypothetical protein